MWEDSQDGCKKLPLSFETERLPQTRESIGIRTGPEITSQFDSVKGFAQPPPPISSRMH